MSQTETVDEFKERASKFWRDFDPNRYPGIEPTTLDENIELRKDYKDRFKSPGSRFLNQLVTSEKLNGGDNPDEDHHFPGMVYSIPIGIYFMRRALGEDKDEAYKIFTHDVYTNADAQKVHPRIPEQEHIERICYEEMINLRTSHFLSTSFDLAMMPAEITAETTASMIGLWTASIEAILGSTSQTDRPSDENTESLDA